MSQTAILITYDNEDSIKEALGLCDAADYKVEKIIRQKFLDRPKYGLGEGKVEELKEIVLRIKPDVIIYDEVLRPSQNYNLASTLKTNILDRESLILEIFARRSTSHESSLQIKLAQFRYEMSRAKEKVRLAKMGEQPGFMGIGMYEVDTYYNDIQNRMKSIKSKLVKMGRQRALHREARRRVGFKTISLAGYTSAGKTTLFNTLTGEAKKESPELFTTLSTTTRKFLVERKPTLISDTVGFISKLPAYMIEAFKSTLEELKYADVVIVVIDVSDSPLELKKKLRSCLKTMADLEVDQQKVIYALNKSDLVAPEEILEKADLLGLSENKKWVPVSAVTKQNISKLLELAGKMLGEQEPQIKQPPKRPDLVDFDD
ncbi:MAG: GTPase HflX [Candidatus Nitrosotenuis sp.]|uniref:GTPase HflX n=1 Tax=Candidatus Nitrosotenuis uzonensis TaxID=1407055 RepID=V6AR25_9ARCH|nr:GTPase HflX [Candidatus Nitrosotenuis uzonensis]CAE6492767.1 GTPase HflX [Candidatus Nitrosotenuis uzonensis]CDI05039.1 GTP1/OBG protein [Candidatus Nitrosotenuis uzonensis]